MAKNEPAFVDESGTFHCPNGHTHDRGPANGSDVYRCLQCGSAWKVAGIAQLRRKPNITSAMAAAMKELASIKGIRSMELSDSDGPVITIDDSNRRSIIANCDAVIKRGKKRK